MHAEMGTMEVFLERLELEQGTTEVQFNHDNLDNGA